MSKKLPLLIIFLLIQQLVYSQAVVLNLDLATCFTCNRTIDLINKANLQVPKYAVFHRSQAEDSVEIEKLYKFSENGYKIIFNTELYKSTKKSDLLSWLVLYNENGQPYSYKDIREINKHYIEDTLSLLAPKDINTIDILITKRSPEFQYILNINTGKISIKDHKNRSVKTIYSSDFPNSTLLSKLQGEDHKRFEHFGINHNFKSSNYAAKYKWVEIDQEGQLLAMYEYSNYKDSSYTKLDLFYCLVKFSAQGEIIDIYPIIFDFDHYVTIPFFLPGEKNSIILITQNYTNSYLGETLTDTNDLKLVSQFSLKNDVYQYEKSHFIQLPKIYNEKYHGIHFGLHNSKFPFVAFYLDNKIYDLRNNKTVNIISDEQYYKHIDFNDKNLYAEEAYNLYSLDVDDKNNVYVSYRQDKSKYYSKYNNQLKRIEHNNFNNLDKLLDIKHIEFNVINKTAHIIGIVNEDFVQLTIPLVLLSS